MQAILALALAVTWSNPPPGEPDAREVEAYVEVAKADAAAGRCRQAAAALREALRRDPRDERARAGLAATCRSPGSDTAVRRGIALLAAGELRSAAAAFEAARAEGRNAVAALAQATCHIRLSEDERARAVLAEALADPATAPAGQLLVAVLARRASRWAEARSALAAAARSDDPRVARAAMRLLDEPSPHARVALALYAGSTFDSNERLAPEGAEIAGGPADTAGTLLAAVQASPLGSNGPFARGSAEYRRQSRFAAHDSSGWSAAAGWRHRGPRAFLSGEYRRRGSWTGGSPYLASDALLGRARVALRRSVALSGGAAWESTRYDPEYARSFSGSHWAGDAAATVAAGPAWLTLGLAGALLRASDPALSHAEHSPRLEAGLRPARWLRAWLECALVARRYEEVDPALGVRRTETARGAAAGAEVTLARGLLARAQVGWRGLSANVASLSYEKWVASVGLAWERSWP
jgi:tetratricopeptide (TPR) repeat protein